MINVELQYFSGCPNSQTMIDDTLYAIEQVNFNIEFTKTLVDTTEMAKNINFRGSPTLLINGIDFENMPKLEQASLSCRYYPNDLPSVESIIKKLTEEINK